ncbi:Hypp2544 [Branchiostoma lanceolatum]|uniref:Hypp2544 protein n=1 Tax=Branchiostoma lanceolatum TaxID=7740 RepID=A0A8J9ZRX5_BRALA|nr:Hypp2544 [Branchiostoma lanceolatum]
MKLAEETKAQTNSLVARSPGNEGDPQPLAAGGVKQRFAPQTSTDMHGRSRCGGRRFCTLSMLPSDDPHHWEEMLCRKFPHPSDSSCSRPFSWPNQGKVSKFEGFLGQFTL